MLIFISKSGTLDIGQLMANLAGRLSVSRLGGHTDVAFCCKRLHIKQQNKIVLPAQMSICEEDKREQEIEAGRRRSRLRRIAVAHSCARWMDDCLGASARARANADTDANLRLRSRRFGPGTEPTRRP